LAYPCNILCHPAEYMCNNLIHFNLKLFPVLTHNKTKLEIENITPSKK
jgi:hypothetical protein